MSLVEQDDTVAGHILVAATSAGVGTSVSGSEVLRSGAFLFGYLVLYPDRAIPFDAPLLEGSSFTLDGDATLRFEAPVIGITSITFDTTPTGAPIRLVSFTTNSTFGDTTHTHHLQAIVGVPTLAPKTAYRGNSTDFRLEAIGDAYGGLTAVAAISYAKS